ncbi:hypothetical protein [Oerskovia enterophila]|uniref:Uncharacterized protein n=1 Tax=Oerskovia enterophila TaxID=43678 RepID=A0A163S661_9CELL|nr:hypothetical protein [Oerskovia enterophila]KZM36054.1 hypothetical protein OJAG_12580 [Oerskovia enterophila]
MTIRTLFRRRRPTPLPVQALEALPSSALPRRVPALFFGAGSTATTEDEALVIASGALRRHGPREAVAVLEGFVSRDLAEIPEREQTVQDPSLPDDDVEREAFAPGSLADQAEAWLADGAR